MNKPYFKTGRIYFSDDGYDCWECTIPSVTYWILLGIYRFKFEISGYYRIDAKRLLGE